LAEIISEIQRRYKKGEIFDFGNVEGQEAGERSEEEREHHEEGRHMDERGGREEKGGRRREEMEGWSREEHVEGRGGRGEEPMQARDPVVDEIMEVKQISETFMNALLSQSLNGKTSLIHLLPPPSSFLLSPSSCLLPPFTTYPLQSPSHLPSAPASSTPCLPLSPFPSLCMFAPLSYSPSLLIHSGTELQIEENLKSKVMKRYLKIY
jgi:hypothetical protein